MASPSKSSGVNVATLNATGLMLQDDGHNATGKRSIKPIELGLNIEHDVVHLSAIQTKFGRAIVCELVNSTVILPRRFSSLLTDADIDELNSKNLIVVYKGSCQTKHNPTSLIEFREKKSEEKIQQ